MSPPQHWNAPSLVVYFLLWLVTQRSWTTPVLCLLTMSHCLPIHKNIAGHLTATVMRVAQKAPHLRWKKPKRVRYTLFFPFPSLWLKEKTTLFHCLIPSHCQSTTLITLRKLSVKGRCHISKSRHSSLRLPQVYCDSSIIPLGTTIYVTHNQLYWSIPSSSKQLEGLT